MSVLTKRAQILFSPEEYQLLKKLAVLTKSSVGELVRKAVKRQYQIVGRKEKIEAAERLCRKKEFPVEDWEKMEGEIMQRWKEK
ncbi:unnamed protein product [marine sediment metagenome]|uniref:Ribbon-helix-helix protein CopG domain-containing protein n=1 Tax=marine sediment metagenome TaxID=412755 RepID=X1ARU1_9ZZZZ